MSLVPPSFKLQKPNLNFAVRQSLISLPFSADSYLKYDTKCVGLQ